MSGLYVIGQKKIDKVDSLDAFEIRAEYFIHTYYILGVIVFDSFKSREFSCDSLWRSKQISYLKIYFTVFLFGDEVDLLVLNFTDINLVPSSFQLKKNKVFKYPRNFPFPISQQGVP